MSTLLRDGIGIIVIVAVAGAAIGALIVLLMWASHRSWKKQLRRAQEERDRF